MYCTLRLSPLTRLALAISICLVACGVVLAAVSPQIFWEEHCLERVTAGSMLRGFGLYTILAALLLAVVASDLDYSSEMPPNFRARHRRVVIV